MFVQKILNCCYYEKRVFKRFSNTRFFPLIDFKIITSGSVISEKYITSDAVFNFSKSFGFGITSDYLSKLYFSLVITRGSTTRDGQIRISFKYRTKKMMHDGIFCHSSLILR